MRVLYANHTSRMSGGELSLLGLLDALPGDLDAVVACPEGELSAALRERDVEVLPIRAAEGSLRAHPVRTPRAIAEMARASAELRRVAARLRPDLVHANSIRAGLICVGASAAGGPPTIVHVRDCLPPGRLSALTLRTIARADALVANSAYTRSRLGPAAASARVIHNGLDLARFARPGLSRAETLARLGLDGGGPVLAVIAQITPWKGQDDAIAIAAGLARRHPGVRLLLVGAPKFDGAATRYDNAAYAAELRRRVADLGLARQVLFLGQRDDVPEILAALDLLLVPSWEEPFGRTIVEAMAAGVPVVATGVGGPAEMLEHEATGFLLDPREPGLWIEAIEAALADRAALERIGRRGRVEARRRFGIERQVARTLELYRAVLSSGRGA